MTAALLTTISIMAMAIPPLTDAQQQQLATATDRSPQFDGAALYPLLTNATQWLPGDEAGATIPDYNAMVQTPAEFRGKLFLIEGQFNGVPPGRTDLKLHRLARPGPWDGKLQQWGVVVRQQPLEVAVVYLVDPPPLPARGAHVRLAARFYKLWRTPRLMTQRDIDQGLTEPPAEDFLVFVGQSATVSASGLGTLAPSAGGHTSPGMVALFLLVILMIGVFFWLRRFLGRSAPRARPLTAVQRRNRQQDALPEDEPDDTGPPLPQDPIEALDELQRRRAIAAQTRNLTEQAEISDELQDLRAAQKDANTPTQSPKP